MRRRPIVAVLLGGTMVAALSGCSPAATASPSAAPTDPTTTWIDLGYLGNSVTRDMASVTSATLPYMTALNAAFADLAKQELKMTLDDGAIQNDRFGRGCSPADASGYASCESSEKQLVANAETDATGTQARIDADFQQAAFAARAYQSVLGVFIGQMVALPWPVSLEKYFKTLVTAARSYRREILLESSISPTTSQSSLSAFAVKSGGDMRNVNAAMRALKAALLRERT